MAIKYVLDTNVVLYHVGNRLPVPVPETDLAVSVMTEIELLSYEAIGAAEERIIRGFLATVDVVNITASVKAAAIAVRRSVRLRLPDAVIVATAMTFGAELWTNDSRLKGVAGLRVRSLEPLR